MTVKHWLRPLLVAVLLGSANVAGAGSWSGYWTYFYTPPPPHWVWTWVWVAGNGGASSAALGALADTQPDCCGITIPDFNSLKPSSVEFTGLLATDFKVSETGVSLTDRGGLQLTYIGSAPLTPGEALGTIVLINPDVNPTTVPPVGLDYSATFDTTEGVVHDVGVITSVPEPASWTLMLAGFAGLGAAIRSHRRRIIRTA